MTISANPLARHFRQPAIYLSIPSKGHFYSENGVDLSATGTIPVYPMTVKDELTIKTPDALMNGQAVIDIIKSCCPAIKDPWEMPVVDMDPVLIAIRLASYGRNMDFSNKCPHCGEEHDYAIDLNMILDNIGKADYSKSFVFDNLSFKFKPQKYKDLNRVNIINFEQDKLVQNVIQNENLTEEQKLEQFKISFEKIHQLSIDLLVDSIDSVTTEDGITVRDREQINEFLSSCSRMVYDNIKKTIEELVKTYKLKPITLKCDNEKCQKEFNTNLTFDYSNFFG
jgi:hypothetical protein